MKLGYKCFTTSIMLILIFSTLSNSANSAPDEFTKAIKIDEGVFPRMAIDNKKRILHLIYKKSIKIIYRQGDLNGNFGDEEIVYQGSISDPRITLDLNGVPHVVASTGIYSGAKTYYTNRIGGKWKKATLVLEKCDRKSSGKARAITPSLAVDADGVAFASAFIGCLCRIENIDTGAKVVKTKQTKYWGHIPLFISEDKLWIFKGEPYGFVELDKQSLEEKGDFYKATSYKGEQFRASQDHEGEIHAAGGAIQLGGPGWYNSLTRSQEGKPNIRFKTTMGHESGEAVPIKDMKHNNRIYVVHWSGATGNQWGVTKGCKENNQLHFARIDNDKLISQMNKVTVRTGPHGSPFRNTPTAVAHPDGGMIVGFSECKTKEIFITFIGHKPSASNGLQKKPPISENDARLFFNSPFNGSLRFSMYRESSRIKKHGYATYKFNGTQDILK